MTSTTTPDTSLPVSPAERKALSRLAALCAKGEHCERDIVSRLGRLGLDAEGQARVMQRLTAEGYVSDTRYAAAYVHDKRLYNAWGPEKIRQGLLVGGVSRAMADDALRQVTEREWQETLRPAIERKRRAVADDDPYTARQKLLRHAASRGFTLAQALAAIGEE